MIYTGPFIQLSERLWLRCANRLECEWCFRNWEFKLEKGMCLNWTFIKVTKTVNIYLSSLSGNYYIISNMFFM